MLLISLDFGEDQINIVHAFPATYYTLHNPTYFLPSPSLCLLEPLKPQASLQTLPWKQLLNYVVLQSHFIMKLKERTL